MSIGGAWQKSKKEEKQAEKKLFEKAQAYCRNDFRFALLQREQTRFSDVVVQDLGSFELMSLLSVLLFELIFLSL